MTYSSRLPLWLCVPGCIALMFLSVHSVSAKTTREPAGPKTLAQPVSSAETVLNVSEFGAVGDGVADDGPAFQSALDALADAGGGTLFVPAGLYLINTPVIKDFAALNDGSITI